MRRGIALVLVTVIAACGTAEEQHDSCQDFVCEAPPAPTCNGNTLVTTTSGACTTESGAPACTQDEQDIDCTAQNQICMDGACIDPCNSLQCETPPPSTCSNGTLTTFAANGTCSASGGTPMCTYEPTSTDCTAADKVCDAGACIDPCLGLACDMPPADTCSGNTLTQHAATGTCSSPGGVAACSYDTTDVDCTATDQVCQGGACVDPCIGVACDMPPAALCVGNVARTYAATGTCSSPGGVPACSYASSDQDCSLSGQTCNQGACTGPSRFCRVQFPAAITDVPATTQTVYARIFVQGVTDQSGGNDPQPTIQVELGLGTGTDPTQFTYTAATPNAAYGPSSPGYEANNDEYQGTFVVPSAVGTTQSYAMRLSDDAGATWLYCDTGNAGSSDGFANPGVLDIAAPYFSEYVEGSSSNKAIEIYNPGSVPFSLTGCKIQVFANGNTTSSDTTITGTSIAAGAVYTLCKSGIADASHCDQQTGAGLWNGNDAVALACGATLYDVIGQLGTDPGAAGWGTGTTTTTDHTLLRNCNVFAGDVVSSDAFDPTAQWTGYAVDTLTYLGARSCPLP